MNMLVVDRRHHDARRRKQPADRRQTRFHEARPIIHSSPSRAERACGAIGRIQVDAVELLSPGVQVGEHIGVVSP